ncbi:MAG TPA: tripartite tricarboxylate transporter substrate binding protein [Burkholderiales bacterium]|nr:tripartite tricarboxylate transporter substrate binding protein [Burkholderiales bacterium]
MTEKACRLFDRVRFVVAASIIAASGFAPAFAQQYPSKPIKIISIFAAGGGNDTISRTVGAKVGELVKQQIIVENRPGANGIVGTELAARAAPDGYTITLIPSGHAVNASLYKKLPYDSIKDFTPISLVGSSPLLLVVHPALPVKSVKELIWFAQARPGELTYSSAGIGSSGHLAGALFDTLTGTKMVHVPYKGNAPALTDLMGGQVFLTFATTASVMPHVRSGRLRGLATTGSARPPSLAAFPTVAEAGVPGYEASLWYGFVGPAGIPQEIVQRLNGLIVAAVKTPEVRERLTNVGVDPGSSTPEELARLMVTDVKRWARVIERTGVQPQ